MRVVSCRVTHEKGQPNIEWRNITRAKLVLHTHTISSSHITSHEKDNTGSCIPFQNTPAPHVSVRQSCLSPSTALILYAYWSDSGRRILLILSMIYCLIIKKNILEEKIIRTGLSSHILLPSLFSCSLCTQFPSSLWFFMYDDLKDPITSPLSSSSYPLAQTSCLPNIQTLSLLIV